MSSINEWPNILGVRIDPVNWNDILQFCQLALEGNVPKHIVTLNGEFVMEATKNIEFRNVINCADLVIPDSINIVAAARYHGINISEPTPGIDLMAKLCQMAEALGKSVFLLGGRDNVAEQAGRKLAIKFPNLYVIGASNADPDNEEIVSALADLKPDIIFVAYGAPKQELWIAKHKNELNAKLLIGVGGSFDMIAGRLPRAPLILRKLHLEWLWRLMLEPSRIGRILNAVFVFPLKVFFYKTS